MERAVRIWVIVTSGVAMLCFLSSLLFIENSRGASFLAGVCLMCSTLMLAVGICAPTEEKK